MLRRAKTPKCGHNQNTRYTNEITTLCIIYHQKGLIEEILDHQTVKTASTVSKLFQNVPEHSSMFWTFVPDSCHFPSFFDVSCHCLSFFDDSCHCSSFFDDSCHCYCSLMTAVILIVIDRCQKSPVTHFGLQASS